MPRARKPRAGSMQFWPRVRAKHSYPRIRSWPINQEVKLLGFAGYKVGMTHLQIKDNRPYTLTKGTEIFFPVTIVECPPLKIASIRFYKNAQNVRLLCHTQPRLTGIGKKKPEIFEVAIGGSKEQQLAYAKEKLGKEISVNEVFKEGQLLDVHSITRGKGFQGPIRRFGIQLRHHKSEKSRRNPGSLGAWNAQGHIMWRTAHAGKMGYHLRTEYNKWLVKIGNKAMEINAKGGFVNYGLVKNPYILVKGSIGGAEKRLIRFTEAIRTNKSVPQEAPQIAYLSLESKQGN